MRDDFRMLVKSSDPVPDYKVFTQYFEILRPLLQIVANLKIRRLEDCFDDCDLIGARSRGDVKSFRRYHSVLVVAVEDELRHEVKPTSYPTWGLKGTGYHLTSQRQDGIREARELLSKLETALPEGGTDTSFFGYNVSEKMLREWHKAGNPY